MLVTYYYECKTFCNICTVCFMHFASPKLGIDAAVDFTRVVARTRSGLMPGYPDVLQAGPW
jgi:hypothetical protein